MNTKTVSDFAPCSLLSDRLGETSADIFVLEIAVSIQDVFGHWSAGMSCLSEVLIFSNSLLDSIDNNITIQLNISSLSTQDINPSSQDSMHHAISARLPGPAGSGCNQPGPRHGPPGERPACGQRSPYMRLSAGVLRPNFVPKTHLRPKTGNLCPTRNVPVIINR